MKIDIHDQNIQNIYAIFGDKIENNQRLIIPGAYQLQGPFRSNVGGISSDILSLSPNARFDSWLTIGITDGDPEVISDCVPKTIEEIEALMKQSSYLSD